MIVGAMATHGTSYLAAMVLIVLDKLFLVYFKGFQIPVAGVFPSQRPVTRSFDVFFDLRLNKQLSKQSRHWRSETPLRSLWRQCNVKHGWEVKKQRKKERMK